MMKVINGDPARPGEVPWQVVLEDKNCGILCGGSILNVKFVLTAAHCIDSFKKDPFVECKKKALQKKARGKLLDYPKNLVSKYYDN